MPDRSLPTYLRASEVARSLGVSTMTVYRLCADQTIPCIRTGRTGRTIRINAADFALYLSSRTAGPAPAPVIPGQIEIPE